MATVRQFWEEVGSRVSVMSPAQHDLAIARISHLPHAMASLLVRAALRDSPETRALAGSGFRDATRIALGPESLWREIFAGNRENLIAAIATFQEEMTRFKKLLMEHDEEAIEAFLREARLLREGAP